MDDLEREFGLAGSTRNSKKPLAGLTILLVEDSRYFADAVRLLATKSGARLRRADSLASARTHMKVCAPDVILVDLCLPDGSGQEFIKEVRDANRHLAKPPAIVAMSGLESGAEKITALENGASTFLRKPFFDLAQFQQIILSVLPEIAQIKGPRSLPLGQAISPDQTALHSDLLRIDGLILDALEKEDRSMLKYCALSLQSIANVNKDQDLFETVTVLASRLTGGERWQKAAKRAHDILQERMVEPAT